jgi:hypothetical protein
LILIGRKKTMMIGGTIYCAYILTYINPVPALIYTFAPIAGWAGSLLWIAQVKHTVYLPCIIYSMLSMKLFFSPDMATRCEGNFRQ